MDELQTRVSKSAFGQVEDPLEGKVVGGLRGEPQIGECVANLRALIKPRATDHAVGQRNGNETLLELAHLERGAHKYRDLIERMAFAPQFFDFFADQPGFFLAIPDARHGSLFAQAAIGKKRLAEPSLVMRDEPGGGGKDMAGRAVIALKPDDLRARKIALETQDIVDLGAAPAVNRLIVIADAAEIFPPLGKQPQPQILRRICVLIFVNENKPEPLVKEFEN